MRIIRIFALIIALSLLLSVFGCDMNDSKGNEETTVDNTIDQEDENVKIKYIYEIRYTDVEFLDSEKKAEWREPLFELLNNEKTPYGDGEGGIGGYNVRYPDKPCIERGFGLSLFDIDQNGIPELFVNMGGGSAGNAFYYIYDIMTGECIGDLDGGGNENWTVYLNRATGKYESIAHLDWRSGWSGKIRQVVKADVVPTLVWGDNEVYQTTMMYAYYHIDAYSIDRPADENEDGDDYETFLEEFYPGVEFRVEGHDATIYEYFEAQDNFLENYVRIQGTEMVQLYYRDHVNEEDDPETKAAKMADLLVSTDQLFLKPQAKNGEGGHGK